jgi:LssY C-terminus
MPERVALSLARHSAQTYLVRSSSRPSMERRATLMEKVDGALFTFAGLSAVWLAYLLLDQGIRFGWQSLLLIPFWVVVTYLMLPRLHRILTRVYVPGYFIGRTRTSDGLLGDPVNLAFRGAEPQVHQAMTDAGWSRADDLTLASGRRIVTSTLRRRSYVQAPVSPLILFDRQQDFAYQQEVEGSPSQRHHVRFWRCPEDWMLPGGYAVDWLAAGTYDRSVGLSLFTLQVTHKIAPDTDVERDYIVHTLRAANPSVEVDVIRDFSTGYHSRNGGGDRIQTDGDLPIVDLTRVPAPAPVAEPPEPTDSRDKRPAQTVFGAGVAVLRGLTYLVTGLGLLVFRDAVQQGTVSVEFDLPREDIPTAITVVGLLLLGAAVVDIGMGVAVLAGRNWARLTLMIFCVFTTTPAFVADVAGTQVIALAQLPSVATNILVLLGLSSHRARDFAARGRARPKEVAAETAHALNR